jgi:hypothetical protein
LEQKQLFIPEFHLLHLTFIFPYFEKGTVATSCLVLLQVPNKFLWSKFLVPNQNLSRFCARLNDDLHLKFMFSKKTTKIDEIFTVDLMLCSKRQIDGEDIVNFCGLLKNYEVYRKVVSSKASRLEAQAGFFSDCL